MSAKNDSPDTSATLSKESRTCPGRDGRETAQNDGSSTADKESPAPTHGFGRFLVVCPPETPISELPAAYERWRRTGNAEQTGLDANWGDTE